MFKKAGLLILMVALLTACQPAKPGTEGNNNVPTGMQITSPAFKNEENIPVKYTCEGEGVSPLLQISGVPEDTGTLLLFFDDAGAIPGEQTHWLMWNIPKDVTEIEAGKVSGDAVVGKNDFKEMGYHAPCREGKRKYEFTLYALKIRFAVPKEAMKLDIGSDYQPFILAEAKLTGYFEGKAKPKEEVVPKEEEKK